MMRITIEIPDIPPADFMQASTEIQDMCEEMPWNHKFKAEMVMISWETG